MITTLDLISLVFCKWPIWDEWTFVHIFLGKVMQHTWLLIGAKRCKGEFGSSIRMTSVMGDRHSAEAG